MTPLTMTVAEFAATFGVSPASVYRDLDAGRIPEIRIGCRRLIPRAVVDRLIADAMAGFDPDAATASPAPVTRLDRKAS